MQAPVTRLDENYDVNALKLPCHSKVTLNSQDGIGVLYIVGYLSDHDCNIFAWPWFRTLDIKQGSTWTYLYDQKKLTAHGHQSTHSYPGILIFTSDPDPEADHTLGIVL